MKERGAPSAIYRLLLRLYPNEFRRRHGAEMTRLFRDRVRSARARGGLAPAWLWVRTLADVGVNAVAVRLGGGGMIRPGLAVAGQDGGGGMGGLWRDLRYAFKSLVRSPGFAPVAVVTIALGIGANTAIFSVTRGVLLAPLPYEDGDRLVLLWGEMTQRGVVDFPASPPMIRAVREHATVFEEVAALAAFNQPLTGLGDPQEILVGAATTNLFETFGVRPVIGRDFAVQDGEPLPPDVRPGDDAFVNNVAILSHGFWSRQFGEDPSVLGRIVEVGGTPTEIVGVLPADFRTLVPPEATVAGEPAVWIAARFDPDNAPIGNVFLTLLARLRPGVSIEQANRDLRSVSSYVHGVDPGFAAAGWEIEAVALHADLTEGVRPLMAALTGAVLFVLLVACANVSNLLLVRASRRRHELSVRAAMGGSRIRLVRQLLLESLLLAGAGAVLGTGLARVGIDALLRLQPAELPRLEDVAIDGTVLGFTVLVTLFAALLFGLVPALQGSRADLSGVLRESGRTTTGSSRLLRDGVIVAEVALSLVLLVGAGLLIRSFRQLSRVDPGFRVEDVTTFNTNLPFQTYDFDARERFLTELRTRLEGLSGVEAVSAAFPLPLEGVGYNGRWGLEEALTDPQAFRQADYFATLPGYFDALRTPLVAGRPLSHADGADSASVVVINETLASQAFPDRPAVGERIVVRASSPEPQWVEIVGVVRDQRVTSLSEAPRAAVYFTNPFVGNIGGVRWVVRSSLDEASLAAAVRQEVARIDPSIPVSAMRPMADFLSAALAPTRFALVLIGGFGALALVLASVGLYGVLSYTVRQRSAEIGVRMAFGAASGTILRLVVGRGVKLSLVGALLGVAAALALSGAMSRLVYGVTARDPVTYASIFVFFMVTATLACALPAIRAARLDPARALREEWSA